MRLNQHTVGRIVYLATVYVLLATLGCLFSMPVLWMLSSSLHTLPDVFRQPFQWVPPDAQWENYVRAFTLLPFDRYLLNTLIITIPSIVFTVISCSLVAYGFARMRFKGRDLLFAVCLATMMLPSQVTMIPLYVVFARIGWVDTFLPLIVPSLFGIPFYIFLLRQFFLTIPRELDETALIDGASRWTILWRIILPQAKPAVVAVIIFSFIGSWNDFFGPLIYINSPDLATLTLGLNMLKTQLQGSGVVEWNILMAAAFVIMLPNVILFFAAQRYFLQGVQLSSMH